MKIYPAGEYRGENASDTNMESSISPIPSNRSISWQPIATFIFLLQAYLIHITIFIILYSYWVILSSLLASIPFILMIRCIRNSWVLPHDIIPDISQPKYLITVRNEVQVSKYCSKCKVFTNSRIVHCRRCDGCHLGYDHFCSWLHCCIHVGNYRFFFFFILSCTVSFFCISLTCVVLLVIESEKLIIGLAAFELVQTFISFLYTFYVCIFHVYLISHGISTKQYFLKYRNQTSLFFKATCHEVDPQSYIYETNFEMDDLISESMTEFEQSVENNLPVRRLKKCVSTVSVPQKHY